MLPVFTPARQRRRSPVSRGPTRPSRSRSLALRLLVVAAAVLSATTPLWAAEAVAVPVSCGLVRNRVELSPAPGMETLAIVGPRDHKAFRLCTFGRCRSLELHRFDVLCGGRPVSWHLIAGQLLDFRSGPARQPPSRLGLKWWEAQALLAEPEFAPVDELGARIFAVADPPAPQRPPVVTEAPPRKPATETAPPREPAKTAESKPETPRPETPRPGTPKSETPKPEPPKSETPKPEAPKPETAKPETAKPETAKPETPSLEIAAIAPRPETPIVETPKPAPPQYDTTTAETSRPAPPGAGGPIPGTPGAEPPGSGLPSALPVPPRAAAPVTPQPDTGGDGRPVDTRPADTRPSDIRPADTRPSDTRPADGKLVEARVVDDGTPGDARPAATAPGDGRPADLIPGTGAQPAADPAASLRDRLAASPLANPLVSAVVAALTLIIIMMAAVSAVRWVSRRLWWMLRGGFSRRGGVDEPLEPDDDGIDAVRACRELMKEISANMVAAMAAVNCLNEVPALQAALKSELDTIRRSVGFTQSGRAQVSTNDFVQMRAELAADLQAIHRILDLAAAASTSFSSIPADVIITTRPEAYAFLGVNASASEAVLKKAVNALRRCWHPDLATDEQDRRIREERIKQINAAWDVITGKHLPA